MTTTSRAAGRKKCLGCPKWLTDPVSQLRGRGPVCWRRWRYANGWGPARRSTARRPKTNPVGERPVLFHLPDEEIATDINQEEPT